MRRHLDPHAAMVVLALASLLHAGTVVTKDGKSFTGDVTVDAHSARIETPEAKRTLALTLIDRIDLDADERFDFEKHRRALPAFDADAHYRMGRWLKTKHRQAEAEEYFRKGITIDADHEAARRELGFERADGGWVYSPVLHHRMRIGWVGTEALAFHWKLAQQLHTLGDKDAEERALRRVLQADTQHREAIAMIRPLVADYVTKNAYRLPFDGRWVVVAEPLGYNHSGYSYMMNAWDFVKVDEEGRAFTGDPYKLESWFTYDAPVYACADGEVYEIRDEFDDHAVGGIGPLKEGNRLLIRHANGERSVIGHLRKGTITAKVGDKVKQGQFIGRIGNNGHSARPHIHFAVYDADGISLPITFHSFGTVSGAEVKRIEKGQLKIGKTYINAFDEAAMKAADRRKNEGERR